MEKETSRELNLVILPGGKLHLEWVDAQKTVAQSSRLLQTEIHERFSDKTDLWLLFLGFSDSQVPLPASLDYWRRFSGSFAKKLCQTPDLETVRHRVKIPVTEEELAEHLARAPMMTGAEYLSTELLEALWTGLNDAFSRAVGSHKGSVEDFIRTYSPNAHLVGRIFFHLVENKSDEYPFAFMATYSTRLNREGKSKHLPLKHALEEYKNDDEKLLELLTTVHVAEKRSPLMGELLETGELFHPLAWTSKEAFTFLKGNPHLRRIGHLVPDPQLVEREPVRHPVEFQPGGQKARHRWAWTLS